MGDNLLWNRIPIAKTPVTYRQFDLETTGNLISKLRSQTLTLPFVNKWVVFRRWRT